MKEGFTQISVADPITKALENVEPLSVRKNIEFETSISAQLPPVNGDSLSLSEAFVNIIGNALKYSQDGSKVVVKAAEKGNDIQILIKDSGIGISQEDLPHVFEGFYRGKSGQEAASGHGIGLAVSRQIVEAHNGTIAVESEPGKGTTFIIRLPISLSKRPA